jgi:hypothetical protein
MQQNQWLALTALKVVEANAFYFDEFPHWRVFYVRPSSQRTG